ncbi:hypothetical protein OSB04_019039 [Centaurea solstitialis]|uniref:GH18 domain-containing protein n=1 Tax=Centaurea solstitialis TaxID=347529 RepID=A0AA38T2X8_9ASTR|nr:hypothetical protein OSB04_019039 [Centaurea solstitialis]
MATFRTITFLLFLTILNHGESVSESHDLGSSPIRILGQDDGVRAAYWPSFTGYPASAIDTHHAIRCREATRVYKRKGGWNPAAKTMLSVGGGGGGSLPETFSQMASREYSRASFINSTIEVAREYEFDGIDLDWEFPSNESDMSNLGLLFQEWRQALEYEANVTKRPRLVLTSAMYYASVVSFDGPPRSYPTQAITRYVDWISPMCFGYHGTWENFTGSHSALYDPLTNLSTDFGIGSWIRAGVPPEKIVMGLAAYGPTWSLQNPKANAIGSATTGTGPGDGILVYSQVVDFNRANNATIVFDNTTVSYYSYSGDSWVSYDDIGSIEPKVRYARARTLAGYFFWALGQDSNWVISSAASQAWLS